VGIKFFRKLSINIYNKLLDKIKEKITLLKYNNENIIMKKVIKEWMELEVQLKIIKDRKDKLTTKLISTIKENKMIDYKILLPDFDIKCVEVKDYESISRKYLLNKLTRYYKDDKRAQDIINYLYDERKITKQLKIKKMKRKK